MSKHGKKKYRKKRYDISAKAEINILYMPFRITKVKKQCSIFRKSIFMFSDFWGQQKACLFILFLNENSSTEIKKKKFRFC